MVLILILFVVVRVLDAGGRLGPMAASYADDLICLPMVLGLVLWAHRRLLGKGAGYVLPRRHGLLTLLFFAVYFEGFLPHWSGAAVADFWDLLMYGVGLVVFEMLMNKSSVAEYGKKTKKIKVVPISIPW